MSDETNTDAPDEPTTEPDEGAEEPTSKEPDYQAEAKKWKALALKHEQKAKASAAAEKKLADLELAGKSETEKLQLLLDKERAEARESRIKALKLSVAAEKGLDPKLAKFLPDLDDEVDMMTAADELSEAAGSSPVAESPSRQPKSNLTNPLRDDAESQADAVLASMMGRPVS